MMSAPAPADEDTIPDEVPPAEVHVNNPRPVKPKYGDIIYVGYKTGYVAYMMNGIPRADGTGFQEPPMPIGAMG